MQVEFFRDRLRIDVAGDFPAPQCGGRSELVEFDSFEVNVPEFRDLLLDQADVAVEFFHQSDFS